MDLTGEKQQGSKVGGEKVSQGREKGPESGKPWQPHQYLGFSSEVKKSWGIKHREDMIYMHKKGHSDYHFKNRP